MGKRELLIISLFVVAGVVAYRLAIPPTRTAAPRLTWTAWLNALRPGGGGTRATSSKTMQGILDITDAVGEARISGIGRVSITGEVRSDIAYTLTVEATGTDAASAAETAASASLAQDRVGSMLTLRLEQPERTRTSASLELRVPSRLSVRTDGGSGTGRFHASNLVGVRLESVVGDVSVTSIAGDLTGSHRNGALTATDVGAVQLTLVSSKATVDGARGPVRVAARNGQLLVRAARDTIELDLTNQRTIVERPRGTLHVLGSGGTLRVETPEAATTVDVRRMAIDLSLDAAVPIAVLTSDAPLQLGLIGPPGVLLEASVTEGGHLRVSDEAGLSMPSDRDTRFVHTFGLGRSTVALRNQRADIVIDAVK